MARSILIIGGPPAVGKSTVAPLTVASSSRPAVVGLDYFFDVLGERRIPPWLPESRQQNHTVVEIAADAAGRYAAAGYDTVLEGVLGPWMLPTLMRGLAPHVDAIDYAVVWASRDAVQRRADERGEAGLQDEGPISTMHEQFADVGPWQSHVIDSSFLGPPDVAARIRWWRERGDLRVRPFSA